ncbi:hypothetical protein P171DRAFT_437095 [Karstenula rhodostoma CBS 690.94]|uniref:Uncharacterized protein n=1 Tax=Karstenula rhodostoma CBS 690.94 TaxID=1392251 RepID=A0A9P4P710_9PLEO|nr:hypothetical protein P171DRAFT_437095 [Karstenula rhodostoma CBS 690.94]
MLVRFDLDNRLEPSIRGDAPTSNKARPVFPPLNGAAMASINVPVAYNTSATTNAAKIEPSRKMNIPSAASATRETMLVIHGWRASTTTASIDRTNSGTSIFGC